MVRNHINKLNKKVEMRGDAARPDEDVIAATVNNDAGESTSTLSALTLSTNGNRQRHAGWYHYYADNFWRG